MSDPMIRVDEATADLIRQGAMPHDDHPWPPCDECVGNNDLARVVIPIDSEADWSVLNRPGLWFTITTDCPRCKGVALTADGAGHITSCMGCLGTPGRVPVCEASIVDIVPDGDGFGVVLDVRPTS